MNFYDNLDHDGSIVVTNYRHFPEEEQELKAMLRRIYDRYHVDYRYKFHHDTAKLVIRRFEIAGSDGY